MMGGWSERMDEMGGRLNVETFRRSGTHSLHLLLVYGSVSFLSGWKDFAFCSSFVLFSTISTLNPICHRWDFSLELSPPPPPAASAFLSSAVAAVTAHVRARPCAWAHGCCRHPSVCSSLTLPSLHLHTSVGSMLLLSIWIDDWSDWTWYIHSLPFYPTCFFEGQKHTSFSFNFCFEFFIVLLLGNTNTPEVCLFFLNGQLIWIWMIPAH